MKKVLAIASDHAGYFLKKEIFNYLKDNFSNIIELQDLGCDSPEKSVDYPNYARKVAEFVQKSENNLGILICGTGIGMNITANKFKNIRATVLNDTFSAKMSKKHNNTNIICLGARVTGVGLAKEIVSAWLESEYEAARHAARLKKISDIERE